MGCLLAWPVILVAVIVLGIAVVGLSVSLVNTSLVALSAQASALLSQCVLGLSVIGGVGGFVTIAALRSPAGRAVVRAVLARRFNIHLPAPDNAMNDLPAIEKLQVRQIAEPESGRQVITRRISAPVRRRPARRQFHLPKDF